MVVKVDESAVETEVFCLLDTADAGVSTEGLRLIVKGRAVSLATAETGMFTTGGVQSNEEIVTDSNGIEATNPSLFKEVVVGGQEAHVLIVDKGKETRSGKKSDTGKIGFEGLASGDLLRRQIGLGFSILPLHLVVDSNEVSSSEPETLLVTLLDTACIITLSSEKGESSPSDHEEAINKEVSPASVGLPPCEGELLSKAGPLPDSSL